MSLRLRVALLTAAAVTLVEVAIVASIYGFVSYRLFSQVEQDLEDAASVIVPVASSTGDLPVRPAQSLERAPNLPRLIAADGRVIAARSPLDLPVTAPARAVASGDRPRSLEALPAGGGNYYVLTVPAGQGRALQVARSLVSVEDVQQQLLVAALAFGAAGIVAALLAGRAVAAGALAPLHHLSRTVERITRTGDLAQRVGARGADELATFARSFDAMLDRLKAMMQEVERQRAELADLNRTLAHRVQEQVEEIERMGRLRRFLSPQIAELVMSQGGEQLLAGHRREITVAFCDLRGFTAFSEMAEPEEALAVLREYHTTLGDLVFRYEGTLEHFAGDGVLVFFNDPIPVERPVLRAVRMLLAMRDRMGEVSARWSKRGHDLGFGAGIAVGYATLGRIGFEGRYDYGAVGPVTNLASRLASEARAGQILISQRAYGLVEDEVEAEPVGEISVKGFSRPQAAHNVVRLKETVAAQA